jgi:hypothetical protein
MRLHLAQEFADFYTGAFTLRFDRAATAVNFMYNLEEQGLLMEFVPQDNLDGVTVTQRAAAPTVISFFTADRQLSQ